MSPSAESWPPSWLDSLTSTEAESLYSDLSRLTSSDPGPYSKWLEQVSPEYTWSWPHLDYIRDHLADVTLGTCPKLAISWPPQHAKTESVTVRYPLWRMLREPGLRVGVATYNQTFTNKQSRKTKRLARRLGLTFGDPDRADEWCLQNGSTFIARGAGAGIAGEPLDLLVIDDPFKSRQEADSPVIQERVYEWYMDDVTPRIQKGGAVILIHTRWNPGDLIGRIQASEESAEWRYVVLKALAEQGDPLGREPGTALCPDRFTRENLEAKRRTEGIGFESLYQQNPIPRGGTFFERAWFKLVDRLPDGCTLVRYWDLAASRKDSACFTAGVLMARHGSGDAVRYYVVDVIRGRWMPAERNEVLLQTARGDKARPGFAKTLFEAPVFDKDRSAERAIIAKLAGHVVVADRVSGAGSKELRAEPLASASKGGIVSLIAGAWNAAYLTEMEGFPRGNWKDQVDSSSGAYNALTRPSASVGWV